MNTGTAAGAQDTQFGNAIGAESSPGGGFLIPDSPNIVDFLAFLSNSVQIPAAALPATSPWPQYAFNQAIDLVLCIDGVPGLMYTLAVYNCATHLVFAIAPDQPGQNFFTEARSAKGFGLMQPSTGIVVSASDEGTSSTVAVPDWAKGLTVDQLDYFKTPWGRHYIAWQQKFGPTIVGLT